MSSLWAFDTWAEFIAMGGHGVYVWASYGAFILLLILLVAFSGAQFSHWKARELKRLHRTQMQNSHREKEL